MSCWPLYQKLLGVDPSPFYCWRVQDVWKWLASTLIGIALGGVPAYFMLASHAVTPDGVRLIIDREYSPSWRSTFGEMQELRAEVAELQRSSAAVQGKLDILIRKYNAALAAPPALSSSDSPLVVDVADIETPAERRTFFHRIAAVFRN